MPNAVSNQCGPGCSGCMLGSRKEEQTAVEVTGVVVNDKAYTLPRTYSKTFDGVNFEKYPNYSRKLENVTVVCEKDTFVNDDFGVDSYIDEHGNLSIAFSVNSEVDAPQIWYKGTIKFDYDAGSMKWSMTGSLPSREWKFCQPGVVVDTLVSALECFSKSDGDEGLNTIRNILAENRTNITTGLKLYSDDCKLEEYDPYSTVIY